MILFWIIGCIGFLAVTLFIFFAWFHPDSPEGMAPHTEKMEKDGADMLSSIIHNLVGSLSAHLMKRNCAPENSSAAVMEANPNCLMTMTSTEVN